MEIVRRVVGVQIDNVGTVLDACLSVYTAGVGAIACHQFAGIFGQCLSGFLVDVTIQRVTLLVGQCYVTSVNVRGKAFLANINLGGLIYFDAVQNPLVLDFMAGIDSVNK